MKKSVNFQNMKYKQTEIPSVEIKVRSNMRRYVMDEYTQNVQGKTVVNKDRGLKIYFGADGKSELAHGRAIYAKNVLLPRSECYKEKGMTRRLQDLSKTHPMPRPTSHYNKKSACCKSLYCYSLYAHTGELNR